MVEIYWYSLIPDLTDFCLLSLRELSIRLETRYPDVPKFSIQQLLEDEVHLLQEPGTYNRITGFLGDETLDVSPTSLTTKRLVVICRGDESFAQAAKSENKVALWGAARVGQYALVWESSNKYLLWHETLHVLGAEDSYDRQSLQTCCEDDRCIMQYVPTEANCGENLFICEKNIALLKANGW